MSLSCHCFRLVFRVHFHLLSPSHSPSVTSLVLVVTYVVSDAALPPVLIYPWIASSLSIFSSNSSLDLVSSTFCYSPPHFSLFFPFSLPKSRFLSLTFSLPTTSFSFLNSRFLSNHVFFRISSFSLTTIRLFLSFVYSYSNILSSHLILCSHHHLSSFSGAEYWNLSNNFSSSTKENKGDRQDIHTPRSKKKKKTTFIQI